MRVFQTSGHDTEGAAKEEIATVIRQYPTHRFWTIGKITSIHNTATRGGMTPVTTERWIANIKRLARPVDAK